MGLVTESGLQATTIEAIVRRARIGYATFYRHFADKEDCFLALFGAAGERTLHRVEDAYEREAGPWADRVRAALSALFAEVAANPEVARACLTEILTAGPRVLTRQEELLARYASLLKPGRELDPGDADLPSTLEDALVGGVLWLVNQRLLAGDAAALPGLLPETLEFVLRPYVGEDRARREADELRKAATA